MRPARLSSWSLAAPQEEGRKMYALATELFPLARSITGDGLRQTLRRLGRGLPFHLHEVPTGTPILDWTVPEEWNCKEAWIKGPDGKTVVDYAQSNLHLMGYSTPLHEHMELGELQKHLHSLPASPDAIPWKTSYYRRDWGFCLAHRQRETLPDGQYEIFIDATLGEGSLSYSEIILPGDREDEVLISSHACHPSLANDNLSGLVVTRALALHLASRPRRFTYRILHAPGTVGAIAWIAQHKAVLPRIRFGLVVAGVGDRGTFSYKRSRQGDAEIDRIFARVLRDSGEAHQFLDFTPDGYDERQYNSLGVGVDSGRLSRTPWGTYPQYHTSGDDLAFITPENLANSLELLLRVCGELEEGIYYRNLSPEGEPQLGRRGLFSALGGHKAPSQSESAVRWLLAFSDGSHSLGDVAEMSGLAPDLIADTARILQEHDLLARED
jgi:aminopeptidase-like protein